MKKNGGKFTVYLRPNLKLCKISKGIVTILMILKNGDNIKKTKERNLEKLRKSFTFDVVRHLGY